MTNRLANLGAPDHFDTLTVITLCALICSECACLYVVLFFFHAHVCRNVSPKAPLHGPSLFHVTGKTLSAGPAV